MNAAVATGTVELTRRIKEAAYALGFALVGASPVEPPPHAESFAAWLRQGLHGEMAYLERTASQRTHPGAFLPWARSIVSVALGYAAPPPALGGPCRAEGDDPAVSLRGVISRYAWGDDYHDVLGARLDRLLAAVQALAPGARGRAFVDAGPVLEHEVAARAGLGWIGKHTLLLHPTRGSWFFLGELFLDLDLEPDRPMRDRCGRCELCLTACPTGAFVGPYQLDARRCISYLTIELKGPIPRDLRPLVGTYIFGCDVCQAVCPYNAKPSAAIGDSDFRPRDGMPAPALIPLLELTEEAYRRRFAGSPILRPKRRGFLRNVCVALGNLKDPRVVPALARALGGDPEPLVRGHAAWALGRIGTEDARRALRDALSREADMTVQDEIAAALREAEGEPVAP